MVDRVDPRTAYGAGVRAGAASYDAGLRSYMLSIYNLMAGGVLLTGIVAFLFSRGGVDSYAAQVFLRGGILKYVIMFAPLIMVFTLAGGINRMSEASARGLYWAFAVVMGVSLSTIFLVYTSSSIATTFFATSAAFGALSLYGYTTKKDLSAIGTFLIMGVVGLVVAMIANMFIQSGPLALVINAVGVLVFAGLTAYDTQKLKSVYDQVVDSDFRGRSVVLGALTLYLDFINLFLFMLRFMGMGGRR